MLRAVHTAECPLWLLMQVSPVRNEKELVVLLLIVVKDITALRQPVDDDSYSRGQRSTRTCHCLLVAHTHSPVRTDRFLHRPRAVLSGCGSIRHGRPGLVRTQCAPLKHMTACGHYSSRSPPNSTVNSHSQTRSLSAVRLALMLLRQ